MASWDKIRQSAMKAFIFGWNKKAIGVSLRHSPFRFRTTPRYFRNGRIRKLLWFFGRWLMVVNAIFFSATANFQPFPGELTFISKCDYCSRLLFFLLRRESVTTKMNCRKLCITHGNSSNNTPPTTTTTDTPLMNKVQKVIRESISWEECLCPAGLCPIPRDRK